MNYAILTGGIVFLFILVFMLGYSVGYKRISTKHNQSAGRRASTTSRPEHEAAAEPVPTGRRLPPGTTGQAGAGNNVMSNRQNSSQQERPEQLTADQPLAARSYPADTTRLTAKATYLAAPREHQQPGKSQAAPAARKGRGQG